MVGQVGALVLGLARLSHGIAQRLRGGGIGIVRSIGDVVEQGEAVRGVEDAVLLIEVSIVGAGTVDAGIHAPEVLGQLLLLSIPIADLLAGPVAHAGTHVACQGVDGFIERTAFGILGFIVENAQALRHEQDVDEVRQVVLRIAERERAPHFLGLHAVGVDLLEQAALRKLAGHFSGHVRAAGVESQCEHLGIVGRGVIVCHFGFGPALLGGENPVKQFVHPFFEGFVVLLGPGF